MPSNSGGSSGVKPTIAKAVDILGWLPAALFFIGDFTKNGWLGLAGIFLLPFFLGFWLAEYIYERWDEDAERERHAEAVREAFDKAAQKYRTDAAAEKERA